MSVRGVLRKHVLTVLKIVHNIEIIALYLGNIICNSDRHKTFLFLRIPKDS